MTTNKKTNDRVAFISQWPILKEHIEQLQQDRKVSMPDEVYKWILLYGYYYFAEKRDVYVHKFDACLDLLFNDCNTNSYNFKAHINVQWFVEKLTADFKAIQKGDK